MKVRNRNKLIVISGIAILLFGFSCKRYMDLAPISEYNSESSFNSNKDFDLAINGMYNIFQDIYSAQLTPAILEGRSDNVDAIDPLEVNHGYMLCSKFVDNSETPELTTIWREYWKMINLSNLILSHIDNISFADENKKSNLQGEAYFFRGYAYFNLGWMFGGVPLIEKELSPDELSRTSRSKQSETLNFAAEDLKKAISFLPEIWPTDKLGKVTKYAAEGILARLYLFNEEYTNAKPLLEDIINSGNYQMATNYKDCFTDQFDNSTEQVFQVQFISGNLGQGTDYPSFCTPQTLQSVLFPNGGRLGMEVSEELYDSYTTGDIRRDFNILKGWTDKAGNIHNHRLFYIKFAHGTRPDNDRDWPVNLPILRYTDVKMMYAEILNHESYSPNGKAFSILNKVRDRAGLSPLTSVEVPSKAAFEDALLNERRWEFAGEYLRWFTLLRTGRAMNTINAFLKIPGQGNGKYKMEEYRKIFAIPQYELNINPNTEYMWQNPGY